MMVGAAKGGMIRLTVQDAYPGVALRQTREAERQLGALRRRLLREERRELQKALRDEAPKGKTGKFARSIRAMVYDDPATGMTILEAYVPPDMADLNRWIIGGTRPHRIPRGGSAEQMAKGYPLRFYWENGPNGPGIYYFWSVWHPGTKPNN